ncbi:MAG: bifunctional riboflavin kinase/FAD synthetase [Candidatus Omnitrophica bacterium]|nr:bifunctional riboflavin kinase/FAD synthetase [Candidatus Omnitrophota bacterium]
MEVFHHPKNISQEYPRPIVAIGVFDGLHRAHQQLIRYIVRRAKKLRGTSMVMTFWPHPFHVLHPSDKLPLIVSLPYRLQLLKELGVDACIVVPFTKHFSRMTPEKFVRNYLVEKVHPYEVVVGDDFRFGKDRKGSLESFGLLAKQYGFHVTGIHARMTQGHKTISSTRIRTCILEGKLAEAAELLGRQFAILGKVVSGHTRGRSLGYPTANINPAGEVLPPRGVYLVNVYYQNKKYSGLANVGIRPSFQKKNSQTNIEVHLLDFHQDLYHQEILVEFLKKIREEKKFLSQEALIEQIRRDEQNARRWFARQSR